ncbi:WhiB family transcriptional regulator [Brachybacterium sp. DNPG3]
MSIGTFPTTEDQSWAARGACTSMDPDGFFVQGTEQHQIKTACASCPVRTECLADALDNRIDFGVWGGMTERERRRLLRRHPEISDWSGLLRRAVQEAVGS